jgi:hypothetical protein
VGVHTYSIGGPVSALSYLLLSFFFVPVVESKGRKQRANGESMPKNGVGESGRAAALVLSLKKAIYCGKPQS